MIGIGEDARLRLPAAVADNVLGTLACDGARGIWLRLTDSSREFGCHVNARPVHEVALLRLGDLVSFGDTRMIVKPDRDDWIEQSLPSQALQPAVDDAGRIAARRVVLRGLSGDLFGRTVALSNPVTIGAGANATIRLDEPGIEPHHATIEADASQVVLRATDGAAGHRVNGVVVRSAILAPGDQLSFGQQRFQLEAPGLPPRGKRFDLEPGQHAGNTQTMRAVVAPEPPPRPAKPADSAPTAEGAAYGWLIAMAVVIGIVIVLALAWPAGS